MKTPMKWSSEKLVQDAAAHGVERKAAEELAQRIPDRFQAVLWSANRGHFDRYGESRPQAIIRYVQRSSWPLPGPEE